MISRKAPLPIGPIRAVAVALLATAAALVGPAHAAGAAEPLTFASVTQEVTGPAEEIVEKNTTEPINAETEFLRFVNPPLRVTQAGSPPVCVDDADRLCNTGRHDPISGNAVR